MRVEVPEYAIAATVSVDPARTGLVIVDMQNDFVRPDGKLPVPGAEETIPRIRELMSFARQHGLTVIYTQDSHGADDPEFEVWGEHARIDTPGWEIIEELQPRSDGGDLVFRKDRYDGFFGTDLEASLERLGIDTLIICGTVANICVLSTAASAAIRWHQVILPLDAVSAITDFDMQLTIRQVAFLFQGTITTSAALQTAAR
ncbi:MAG TPA: isochorismatase family cysteine hydrolase [Acidobacteriota bacterium]|nr:isochorismatase family cysteine hydrolase [Acidobacteriota bacterium]